ncbi:MAG: sulfotransferase [Halioglobus sp.]
MVPGAAKYFLVIGTMKGGTTSLYSYLKQHPDLDVCRVKELNFFNNDTHWAMGKDWYERHFRCDGKPRCDVNPNYAMYPFCQAVPERLFEIEPEARLIYVLRDPIERAVSHMQHYVSDGIDQRSVAEIMADLHAGEDPYGYLTFSRYHQQLERFQRLFPMEHILLLRSEELRQNREQTMRRLYSFMNVPFADGAYLDEEQNQSGRKRTHPRWMKRLFQHRTIGGFVHTVVLWVKRLLPPFLYDKGRSLISSKPNPVTLTEADRRFLHKSLAEDWKKMESWLAQVCGKSA